MLVYIGKSIYFCDVINKINAIMYFAANIIGINIIILSES